PRPCGAGHDPGCRGVRRGESIIEQRSRLKADLPAHRAHIGSCVAHYLWLNLAPRKACEIRLGPARRRAAIAGGEIAVVAFLPRIDGAISAGRREDLDDACVCSLLVASGRANDEGDVAGSDGGTEMVEASGHPRQEGPGHDRIAAIDIEQIDLTRILDRD